MIVDPNQLIDLSIKGDTDAFGELVVEYSNFVFSIVFRMVNDEMIAEDLVQDTFVKAWQSLAKFNSEKSRFTTWLYTIASRLSLDWLKSNKSSVRLETDHERFFDVLSSPHQTLENKELGELISWACERLSEQQKMVFVLRELEQLSVVEVMKITGYSEKKIVDNLYVAKKNVRNQLVNYIKIEV